MPGLRPGDTVLQRMLDIIQSPECRKAAREAAEAGEPPMARVDPLLQKGLGADYNLETQGPQRASWEVNKIMRKAGFKEHGKKPCGEGRVCKRATFWVP